MSTPVTPSNPSPAGPAGDDRNLVPVDATTVLSFEDRLEIFWQKYRGAVLGVCVVVILAILGKGGWEYMERQKDAEVKKAYAAATTAEQLKTFSAANPGHPLSAVAQVRIADEAYAAGKGADAVAAYDKALTITKDGPLAVRAKLGRAVAKVSAGKAAEATTELAQLANDANTFKGVRAEAAYHLTSLAVEAKNSADAQKYSDLLMQIDPTSPWTQRGLALRASLPAPAASAAPAAPDASGAKVEVKLPGAK